MTWISNLFSRYWRNVHLGVAAFLVVVLIYGDVTVNGLVSELFVRVFHYPFNTIKTAVAELTEVSQENDRLRQALVDASVKLSQLEEDRRENARLRAVLGFEPPAGYGLLPARVISVAGERVPLSAVVNRGLDDSLVVYQPVINEDGLIGRVRSISPGFAYVQLLTDPANRVASRVANSRGMGIAKAHLSGSMFLDNFPVQEEIYIGDTIITSGLGGVYPAGLIVGTVKSVDRPEEATFCEIELTPAADFYSLDELFILRPMDP